MITGHKVESATSLSSVYKQRGRARTARLTPSLDRTVAQDTLLEEMAMYFTALEATDVWPEEVFAHCNAWASLMGLELGGVV